MKELDNDIMDTYRCTEEYFSSNKFGNIDKNIMMFLYKNMPLYLNVPYNVVENLLERHGKIERIDHSSRLW